MGGDASGRATALFVSLTFSRSSFEAFRRWYAEHGSAYRWVGFNSLGYDNHIVAQILEGVDDPAELYTLSGALVNNNTWWRSTRDTAGGEQVGDVTYNLGWGGLHSNDEPGLFVADQRSGRFWI